jgi:hypothetical protein
MTNEELNTKLYEKLFAEQKEFKGWLLKQPPEEILGHAYEYTIREDIILEMEYLDLSDEQAKALIDSEKPLEEILNTFEKIEGTHMDEIRDCIEARAKVCINEQKEALRNLPVYTFSATFAKSHQELEVYRASHRANVECKNAIEEAINAHYRDNRLDISCVQEVLDRFGMERTCFVVANTVQDKEWDGRIARENKEWAKEFPVPNDANAWGGRRTHEYVCSQAHPGLINLFVNHLRKEQELAAEKKPSVLKKLKEAKLDVQPKAPTKKKEVEL